MRNFDRVILASGTGVLVLAPRDAKAEPVDYSYGYHRSYRC